MHNDLISIKRVPAERQLEDCVICELQDRKAAAVVGMVDIVLCVPRGDQTKMFFRRIDIKKECGGHHVYTAGLCGNHAELYPMYPFID